MKFHFSVIAMLLFACAANAQSLFPLSTDEGSWKQAFSEEGRKNWKPEFTLRYSAGFVTSGPALTAGIRVDDKRTLGIWLGKGDTYNDANPSDVMAIQTAAYMRRYVYLGSRDIVALYGDLYLGCGWIYQVNGKYRIYDDPQTGEHHEIEMVEESKGDVEFYGGISAGVRFRIVRNFHIFLGPTLTTNLIGLHLGLGF